MLTPISDLCTEFCIPKFITITQFDCNDGCDIIIRFYLGLEFELCRIISLLFLDIKSYAHLFGFNRILITQVTVF